MKPIRILCLCDSLTLTSGFARVANNFIRRWAAAGDVVVDVWGIAFQGWKYKEHPYVRQFFPAGTGQQHEHWASAERLQLFLQQLQFGDYTHVWIMQDTFQLVNFGFPQALRRVCNEKGIRSVLYFPVDAPLDPEWTDIIAAVDLPVAYTDWGAREARDKLAQRWSAIQYHNQHAAAAQVEKIDTTGLDYARGVTFLPHGVDTTVYHPLADRDEIRKKFWSKEFAGPDDFLLLNVNVNQRRKDVGRSLELLAGLRAAGVPAKLVMHMANVSDDGLNLELIGRQLGLRLNEDWTHHDHLFVRGQGRLAEAGLVQLYNLADLYLTTTLGEGWGLGITEALACGTSIAVPVHTACAEIAAGVEQRGMAYKTCLLPIGFGSVTLGLDNSRLRPRVDLERSVAAIQDYYASGEWRKRSTLHQPVRAWLSWDRVADTMLEMMVGVKVS